METQTTLLAIAISLGAALLIAFWGILVLATLLYTNKIKLRFGKTMIVLITIALLSWLLIWWIAQAQTYTPYLGSDIGVTLALLAIMGFTLWDGSQEFKNRK